MKTMFRVMTTTIFAALLGAGAIAQAAVPVATSNQQLSAKDLLRTEPKTSQLLAVPQLPPAFSTINVCYGSCGGPADALVLPRGGEVSRDTQVPVLKIFGNIQPFMGTPMDPNAIGAKVPIFKMP
jgi:hypothetical protein